MSVCDKCGKEIRFIKRKGSKALTVNVRSVYFLPDDFGSLFVTTTGTMRRGTASADGIKGFVLHSC